MTKYADIAEGAGPSQDDEDFVVAIEQLRNNVLILLSGQNLPLGVTQRLNTLFDGTIDVLDDSEDRPKEEDDGA